MPIDEVVEPVAACEPLSEAAAAAIELRKRESEEAAAFITRQVFERGATLFDG